MSPGRIRTCVLLAQLALSAPAAAQDVLHGFVDEPVVTGLTVPVAFTTLPDGRILVAEKAGVVRVVRAGRLLPDAFIDLRSKVNDYWDRGLLGIAADPAFALNGYVYLFYVHEDDRFTYSGPKTSRVVRVTATGDTASSASEVVLLGTTGGPTCSAWPVGADCLPADSPSHNGGALRFGPDGALWITTGDAASFNAVDARALRTQQLDSLAGKLLRVSGDGRGRADNPFFTGNADDARSKVWAYGFRNPFRLTFRPDTGRPYVADVGAGAWEEVNAVTAGANFGWPCYEGAAPQPGYQPLAECLTLIAQGAAAVTAPLAAYPHAGGTAAIAGGAFYTGNAYPDLYRGAYFFGDFARGTLHYLTVDGSDGVAGPIKGFAANVAGPVDVQTDAQGIVYLSVTTGALRRIRYTPDTGARYTVYLSDSVNTATSASSGAGPVELDRSHGAGAAGDGGPLTLGGHTYAKGLGVKAPSDIRFALGGVCTAFSTVIGVDGETVGEGSVTFELWLDGVRVGATGVMRGGEAPFGGTVDITARQELRLVVTDAGDGHAGDHADWADARLECTRAGGDTVAPIVVVTTPTPEATGVAVNAVMSATFSEELNASSVSTATATLVDPVTSAPVHATVTYDAAVRRVTLTPSSTLSPGTRYRITMVGGAGAMADTAGNALASSHIWHITTTPPVVNQAPLPVLLLPATNTTFRVGQVVAFSGSATDAEDGDLPLTSLQWQVSVRHCPGGVCHTHPLTTTAGATGSIVAPEHGADSYLVVTLTATDSGGRSASVSTDVHPRLVTVTLLSEPPGVHVVFGETRALTPATFQAVAGSHMSVATLSPQQSLSFTGWASGAAQQHTLLVGDTNIENTARFAPPAGVSYLSDLAWTLAENGAGPVARDRSHGDTPGGDGPPLVVRGVTYAKGLGVRAPSDIRVRVNGACTLFAATLAIDDDVQGGGTIVAGVVVDGRIAFQSPLVDGVTPPIAVSVDLTGVRELRLVVADAGDGNVNDEVDWADARVTCNGPGATVPAAPGAVSALAAGQTAALWWTPVPGASSYRVESGTAHGATDLAVVDVDANSISGMVPLGASWVRVRAGNAWGWSPPSADVRLVVDGTTGAPLAPGDLAATVSGVAVTLTWIPPLTGALPSTYIVEAGLQPDALPQVASTPATTIASAGVPPGTYHVRVRAVTSAGAGPPTSTIVIVVP